MGFFNFHKKTELLAPMTGRVIPLEKVPDAVFSQKTLGRERPSCLKTVL